MLDDRYSFRKAVSGQYKWQQQWRRIPWGLAAWRMVFVTLVIFGMSIIRTQSFAGEMELSSGELRFSNPHVHALLMNTQVEMKINGMVGRITVQQQFKNPSDQWLEGVYLFPLPESAAVDRMKLRIGYREVVGEIQEKQAAEKKYQQAKASGQRASVVHQQRANLFTTKVANIAPNETVWVEISYLQTLDYDQGEYALRFPLTITPRYNPANASDGEVSVADNISPPQIVANRLSEHAVRIHQANFSIQLDAGGPLDVVESLYHPVEIDRQGNLYQLELAQNTVPMDRDFVLRWKPAAGKAPKSIFFTEQIHGEYYGLLMLMPPKVENAEAVIHRDITFVIDTSGSMGGTSIEQAKEALLQGLADLTQADSFNIIAFNSNATALYETSRNANFTNIRHAQKFVSHLEADGGTRIDAALRLAFDLLDRGFHSDASQQEQIVFITDGSVGNEESLFEQIKKSIDRRRLFTVGIGSAPNSFFMRKAAEFGRGGFTQIGDLNEVKEKMQTLFEKIKSPQLINIAVESDTNPDLLQYPEAIPDLYQGEPIVLSLKSAYPLDSLRINGQVGYHPWQQELALSGDDREGIAGLFGRARLEQLEDDRVMDNSYAVNEAILTTALEFQLVSRHTSLVAVDVPIDRPVYEGIKSQAVPNLMPAGNTMASFTAAQNSLGFPATASPAIEHVKLGGIFIVMAFFFVLLLLTFKLASKSSRDKFVVRNSTLELLTSMRGLK